MIDDELFEKCEQISNFVRTGKVLYPTKRPKSNFSIDQIIGIISILLAIINIIVSIIFK